MHAFSVVVSVGIEGRKLGSFFCRRPLAKCYAFHVCIYREQLDSKMSR